MSVVAPLSPEARRVLRLYVAGEAAGSVRARRQLKRIEQAYPHITVEIVDVLASPGLAETAGILATPTLSDESRSPPRRIVGDLSDMGRVTHFLGLDQHKESR
jgi:circadian clock protein KaiB